MKALFNPAVWERVMVLAPHPDDETLATAGLLQQAVTAGAAVRVLFATDGDNNPWPQRAIERRWRITIADRARWGRRRRGEALAALACLGVPADSARFLGYPDQGLTALLLAGSEELLVTLVAEIAEWRPTLLVTPSALDRHPDHSALAVLVRCALARLGPDQPRFTEISYLVHAGPATHNWLHLRLCTEEQARKRAAILCHTSQLALSRRRFLAFAADSERFITPADPSACDEHHPVRRAVLDGSILRLEVVMRARPGAFGKLTLYVATDDLIKGGVRRAVVLPGKPARVNVHDVVSGAVIRQARFCGNWQRGEVLFPLSALLPAESVFVKLERQFGFFDEAGWRELPIVRPRLGIAPIPVAHPRETRPDPVVCCVLPCYNVATLCGEVVREAATYANHVIAVNDGSTDKTGQILDSIAAESGGRVRVLSFASNRGKGAALLAGFRYALKKLPFDVLVTLDGDCQHRPADIPRLLRAWKDGGAALIIGERLQLEAMPLRSRLGNTLTRALLRRLYPASPRDTQSGLRALDRSFVEEVVRVVKGRRYETELHILLLALDQQQQIRTVPIPTVYLDGNRSSHFRPVIDSLRIYWALLGWRLPVLHTGSFPQETFWAEDVRKYFLTKR